MIYSSARWNKLYDAPVMASTIDRLTIIYFPGSLDNELNKPVLQEYGLWWFVIQPLDYSDSNTGSDVFVYVYVSAYVKYAVYASEIG